MFAVIVQPGTEQLITFASIETEHGECIYVADGDLLFGRLQDCCTRQGLCLAPLTDIDEVDELRNLLAREFGDDGSAFVFEAKPQSECGNPEHRHGGEEKE